MNSENDDNPVNPSRRRFLTAATSVVGVAGAVGVAVPFVGSWKPSAKAKAAGAPVKVDIGQLEPGTIAVVEWRGKPVYVLRRTPQTIKDLPELNHFLKDPDSLYSDQPTYVGEIDRSVRPDILVLVGLCTHLGCATKYRSEAHAADLGGQEWLGGFFCPCHGSKFDLAGRVYKGVPASTNLVVPPYYYETDQVIVIGVDEEENS